MTGHDIEALTRRFYDEVWNARRYDVAEELFDPGYLSDSVPGLRGGAAKAALIRNYHSMFPDLRVAIEEIVAADDRTAVRFFITGTDTAGFKGRQPTGKQVSAWAVEYFHFRDGRIDTDWVGVDWLGLFVQLGVVADPWV